jgi:hypothetical protein
MAHRYSQNSWIGRIGAGAIPALLLVAVGSGSPAPATSIDTTGLTTQNTVAGKGCSAPYPPYSYYYSSRDPGPQPGNDPYYIGFEPGKLVIPGPDGAQGMRTISVRGKHGAVICRSVGKVLGSTTARVRCLSGRCVSTNLGWTIRGNGVVQILYYDGGRFDVRTRAAKRPRTRS